MIDVICKNCGNEQIHYAKGLCGKCYSIKYDQEHKNQKKEWDAKHYRKNKKYLNEHHAKWCQEHKEQIKEYTTKHYQEHKTRIKKYAAGYQKEHPDIINACNRRRRIAKLNAEGFHTIEQWKILKEEYNQCCGYCGKYCDALVEDHIIALTLGGSDWIWNIKPACKSCNCSKLNRPLHIFLEEKINQSDFSYKK